MKFSSSIFFLLIFSTLNAQQKWVDFVKDNLGETVEWRMDRKHSILNKHQSISQLTQLVNQLDNPSIRAIHSSEKEQSGYGILELKSVNSSYRIFYFSEKISDSSFTITRLKVKKDNI